MADQDLKITLDRQGAGRYRKASYPIRYGRYVEIEYNSFRFQFNLNGEIKYIAGTGPDWPHPAEWLKRTIGNDWLYYSTGSYYAGVVDLFGEYYLPCPAYPTNTLFREDPFARPGVAGAMHEFDSLISRIRECMAREGNPAVKEFLALAGENSSRHLRRRAEEFHRILRARVSVLPPDCRHVDYDVIPLMITDGCRHNCAFCEIKTGQDLTCRTWEEVSDQLLALKDFYGPDLENYNSVFLGQHDALAAEGEDIVHAAEQAYRVLEIERSCMREPRLFLFGSSSSLLQKNKKLWQHMNKLPFYTYVNIGLESLDEATLQSIKKPVSAEEAEQALLLVQALNREYGNIEVTANFILGNDLPPGHVPSMYRGLGRDASSYKCKGCIYISPLKGSRNRQELLDQFREIKRGSQMETLLYLIQRL